MKPQSKNWNTIILKGNQQQIKALFPQISLQLDVAETELEQVMNGSQAPLERIMADAKLVLPKFKYRRLVRSIERKRLAIVKLRLRSRPSRFSSNRVNLLNYLKGLTWIRQLTWSDVCRKMGFRPNALTKIILRCPKDQVINALRQVPFIFNHVTLNDLRAILKHSFRPQETLLNRISRQVHNRPSLKKFICLWICLLNSHVRTLSIILHRSVSAALDQGTGDVLARLFHQLAFLLDIPDSRLQMVLSRANLRRAHHSYWRQMNFWIHYKSSPVNYREPRSAHAFDRKRIARGFEELHSNAWREKKGFTPSVDAKDGVWLIISGWSFMFNFDAKALLRDNFAHFDRSDPHPTQIKHGDQLCSVTKSYDWLVILQKLHGQLNTVRHAFNLTEVQEGNYGRYTYIRGVGQLEHPEAKNFRSGLAKLKSGRYRFLGRFSRTGIKAVQRGNDTAKEYYVPTLLLKDIKYDHRVVARAVWFNYSKSFVKLGQLEPGDLITFKARVHRYKTGHIAKNSVKLINYELNYPTSIKLARRYHARTMMPMPQQRAALTGYAIESNHSAAYDFSYRNYRYARRCKNAYLTWKKGLGKRKSLKK